MGIEPRYEPSVVSPSGQAGVGKEEGMIPSPAVTPLSILTAECGRYAARRLQHYLRPADIGEVPRTGDPGAPRNARVALWVGRAHVLALSPLHTGFVEVAPKEQ